ncbi:MAG TPA: ArsC/Spx/MgsR family protein [Burkholderiales bacterium]|nr:ArsC/Spx/MgsR family protein [Burkholderiales bacterium]
MKPKVYGIRNCDTMKKAFAWLEARKVGYDFHDYKKEGIAAPKPKEWAARALELLQQNPSAIRRPIVERGTKLLVGFDPAEFEAAL